MEIAARFLATRPRTRWELERRLRRGGATEEVVASTLERLVVIGQADDLAFARWWAQQRDQHAPRGQRLVEAELRQRGVPRDVIEELRAELSAEGEAVDSHAGLPRTEAERATMALERHLRGRPLPDDPKALQRIGVFLVRRGFDPETVRATIRAAARAAADAEA